jgi:hypothetical protein
MADRERVVENGRFKAGWRKRGLDGRGANDVEGVVGRFDLEVVDGGGAKGTNWS